MKPYVRFDTNILDEYVVLPPSMFLYLTLVRRTLVLEDKNNGLAALVVSHMTAADFWTYFCVRIKALYGHEMHHDESKRVGYDYIAVHYHWYNRYAEQVRYNTKKDILLN